jgi:hypothetical protein
MVKSMAQSAPATNLRITSRASLRTCSAHLLRAPALHLLSAPAPRSCSAHLLRSSPLQIAPAASASKNSFLFLKEQRHHHHQPATRSALHCNQPAAPAPRTCSTHLLHAPAPRTYSAHLLRQPAPRIAFLWFGLWFYMENCSKIHNSIYM